MQLGLMKRILAMGLCVAMLSSDCLPILAETVSGSDLPVVTIEEQEIPLDESNEVEDSNLTETEQLQESNGNQVLDAEIEESMEEKSDETSEPELETKTNEETQVEETTVSSGDSVSAGDFKEIKEEEVPLDAALNEIVLEKKVNDILVKLIASEGVLPEGATLSVVEMEQSSEENQEQVQKISDALKEEATKNEEDIVSFRTFDIKILVDGKEVQPEGEVKVIFTGVAPEEDETVSVYHVDAETNVNEMITDVTADGVEMTTNHFSVFTVTRSKILKSEYKLTINHYYDADKEKAVAERSPFYYGKEITLTRDEKLTATAVGGVDYSLEDIIFYDNEMKKLDPQPTVKFLDQNGNDLGTDLSKIDTSTDPYKKCNLSFELIPKQNMTAELFYKSTTEDDHTNDVTYFDYSVMSQWTEEEKYIKTEFDRQARFYISFTLNGERYTRTVPNEYNDKNKFYITKDKVIKVKDGDVLTDVVVETYEHTSWYPEEKKDYKLNETIPKLTVVGNGSNVKFAREIGIKYHEKAAVRNSGINSYGLNHAGKYLSMGQTPFYSYSLNMDKGGTKINANTNNASGSSADATKAIIPGILTGLSGENYQNVETGINFDKEKIVEPGYFSGVKFDGKEIYDDRFQLKFKRDGHKYSLISSVDNKTGNETLSEGGDSKKFFPLNEVAHNDTVAAIIKADSSIDTTCLTQHGQENNCFYGMRYDFKFTLGDYAGPLDYTFVGDDDLWVFMDGELVLDLGGLHQCYPYAEPYHTEKNGKKIPKAESNKVDLWGKVKDKDGNYDKNKEHQITVLFMERGAWESSCYMEFTMPQVTTMDTVITEKPKGNVEFTKTTEDGKTALAGAVFGLYRAEGESKNKIQEQTSDANGKVFFPEVKEGEYFIQEIKAPKGYKLDETQYPVSVISEKTSTVNVGTDLEGIIKNEKIDTMDFSFEKIDARTKKAIQGVSFELWGTPLKEESIEADSSTDPNAPAENPNTVIDPYATKLQTAVSDQNGKVLFKELPMGTYLLKELKFEGYVEAGPWIVNVIPDPTSQEKKLIAEIYEAKKGNDGIYNFTGEVFEELIIENTPEVGDLIIQKKVNKVNLPYGAPSFIFRIEGPNNLVLYRTITFEDESTLTKSITVKNLPVGVYAVTEIPEFRYKLVKATKGTQKVTIDDTPTFCFENHLKSEKKYSHSDIVVNSFRKNDDGTVKISQNREVTEEREITVSES